MSTTQDINNFGPMSSTTRLGCLTIWERPNAYLSPSTISNFQKPMSVPYMCTMWGPQDMFVGLDSPQ